MPFTYEYPRPAVTVDCVVLRFAEPELKVLLIQRKHDPCKDAWALPGGFVDMDEELDAAARRELKEETGVAHTGFLEQIGTFGKIGRDPRGRTISVVYMALLHPDETTIAANDDADDAKWVTFGKRHPLAFDHKEILRSANEHLKEWMRIRPIAFHLLPRVFALSQLENLYEILRGKQFDKRTFSRHVVGLGILDEISAKPRLYRFNEKKFSQLQKEGFVLNL